MIESMMSLDERTWEIRNPPHLKSPNEPDLFVESHLIRDENKKKAVKFYDSFL